MKELNIIMGISVDNESCRKIKQFFTEGIQNYLKEGYTVHAVNSTTDRMKFDDSVRSGEYNVGFVLEVMNGNPIGQGGIKAWRRENSEMQIILVMDKSRKSTGKAKGLYDIGYYDGLFLDDISTDILVNLIENGRSKEEAYIYYGLDHYVEPVKKGKAPKSGNTVVGNNGKHSLNEDKSTLGNDQDMILKMASGAKRISETVSQLNIGDEFDNENVPNHGTQNIEISEEFNRPGEDYNGNTNIIDAPKEQPTGAEEVSTSDEKLQKTHSVNESIELDDNNDMSNLMKISMDVFGEDESVQEKGERYFSDSGAGADRGDSSVQSLLKDKKSYVRRSLDEIAKSREELLKYFNGRTSEAYNSVEKKKEDQDKVKKKNKKEFVENLFIECYEQFASQYNVAFTEAAIGATTSAVLEDKLFDVIEDRNATSEDKIAVLEMFMEYTYGYDLLKDLIETDGVTEIHVLTWDKIRVKKGNERYSTTIALKGYHRYEGFCQQLYLRNRDRLTSTGTTKTFTDSDYSKKYNLEVSIRSADITTTNEPELHIRKIPKNKRTLKSLCTHKNILKEYAAYLSYAAIDSRGILIIGKRTSGRSTVLNALLDYLPSDKSGIVVQRHNELVPGVHPEISVLHPLVASGDNPGASMIDLAYGALSENVEYYILGDVEGPESDPFYKALLSGYICWSCITCESPEESIDKLAKYVQSSGNKTPYNEIVFMICDKIGTIVCMDNLNVKDIYRVEGFDENNGVILKNIKEIFEWRKEETRIVE